MSTVPHRHATCASPADIDDAFDTYGLAATLLDGRLSEPVAGRLLARMPVEYIQELLLPVSLFPAGRSPAWLFAYPAACM